MALAVVQHTVAFSAANATTVAITVTATGTGRLLVVGTACNEDRTVTGVSDGTTAFTQFTGVRGALSGISSFSDIWYLPASSNGKTTITITFSGVAGTFEKLGWFWEVSGFTTAGADVGTHVDDQTATVGALENGGSVTTTSTTGFVVGVVVSNTGTLNNPHIGNEFTSGGDIEVGTTFWAGCSLISSTAAAHQPAWDGVASDPFAASTASWKETGGGATPFVTSLGAQLIPRGKPNYSAALCTFVVGTALTLTQLASAPTPFMQTEWAPPVRARSAPMAALTHTQARPQYAQDIQPFSQTQWPLVSVPRPAAVTNLTHLQARPQFAQDIQPFSQASWPLPRVPDTLLQITLATRPVVDTAPPIAAPTSQTDWRVPWAKPAAIALLTWTQERKTYYSDIQPFRQTSWPPGVAMPPASGLATITQDPAQGPLGLPLVTLPPGQALLALPRVRPTVTIDWLFGFHSYDAFLPPTNPLVQTDWPIPIQRAPEPITKRTHLSYYVIDETPPIKGWTDLNPVRRPSLLSLGTWTQNRPTYLVSLTLPTGHQEDWPVPAPRPAALALRTWTQSLLTSTLSLPVGAPLVPQEWIVPARRRAVVSLTMWSQNLIASTLAPAGWGRLVGGERNHLVREIT